jgi:large subunit ribosomal protein L21
MYAIIESCGKQYKVTEGDVVFFKKLDVEEGKKVTFDNVVLVSEDGKVQVGAPYVKGAKVVCEVLDNECRGDKVLVFHKKRRKGFRKLNGHRQDLTNVVVKEIVIA